MNEDTNLILNELKAVRSDMSEVKHEICGLKQDVSEMKQEICEMKQDISVMKQDISKINLKLENDIEPAIKILAENQLELNKKMDTLFEEKHTRDFEIDLLKMRVNKLEIKCSNL